MKEQVLQIVEGPVVPREADQQPAVKLTFCKDDSAVALSGRNVSQVQLSHFLWSLQ